ncbi:hypothetical protein MKW94_003350 [Papaver nudicaule]|uniref:Phytocyanin domain-containing protein n=1 Tax=Papaver nudicaule TaxID=74823 RepID=A0AA42APH7_PAPNU|nr:hypothetical protein [Papaver nudicaule]
MGFRNKNLVLLVVTLIALCNLGSSTAKIYDVGDTAGWTHNVNYTEWASSKAIHPGDTVRFKYDSKNHNLVQVTYEEYWACSAKAPLGTYASGNDSIHITGAYDDYYFICDIPGRCDMGQRVHLKVTWSAGRASSPPHTPPPSKSSGSKSPTKSSKSSGCNSPPKSSSGSPPESSRKSQPKSSVSPPKSSRSSSPQSSPSSNSVSAPKSSRSSSPRTSPSVSAPKSSFASNLVSSSSLLVGLVGAAAYLISLH